MYRDGHVEFLGQLHPPGREGYAHHHGLAGLAQHAQANRKYRNPALVLIAVIGSLADAQNRAKYVGYTALAAVIVAALVFLYALLRAPYLAYEEVRPRNPSNAALAKELEDYFVEGQQLLVRVPSPWNYSDFNYWVAEYGDWCESVEKLLEAKSTPEERFMFSSISPSNPVPEDTKSSIDKRLQKLRLIISRCLKPKE